MLIEPLRQESSESDIEAVPHEANMALPGYTFTFVATIKQAAVKGGAS